MVFNSRDALWPNYNPPRDLIFTHGKGSELFSEQGDAYLDFLSGIAVTSFGHAHPHLISALNEQAGKIWHVSNLFRIPAAERLAQRLVDVSFADNVFFANSGAEAVEAGLKAMRSYHAANGNPQRTRIVGFNSSFHGRTIATVAVAGNKSHTQNFVPSDPDKYIPGINYMIRPDGRRVKLTDENWEFNHDRLEPGFIVERHLMDGDIVLFNRQPSLHRMSMMAHEVRIMKGKTFRINLCVCPPYNADFDGDEMNLHVVQSEEARAEARILMRVQEHIRSPRFGGAVIGAIHDHITGMFLLTHGDASYDIDQTVRILSRVEYKGNLPKPAFPKAKGGARWSGRQIFSVLLPKDMNLTYNASVYFAGRTPKENRELDTIVEIVNGQMQSGPVDGNSISAFKGRILEEISRLKGPNAARDFIDKVTRLAVGALMETGCTTGIDDADVPEEALSQITVAQDDAVKEVDRLVKAYNKGKLQPRPGRSVEETLEVEVMGVLGRARDKSGEIAGWHLGMDNFAVIMARSGARGSMLNLSQMAGSIGQQAVRGERISRGYEQRTLSHFNKGDLGADAKGFVRSSYKRGLSPTEYFFHSMGGREGLVDTAVRTSRSGYMQRRLVNALEDLRVKYDGTVRNTANTVVQFKYGEDSIDPTKSKFGKAVDIDSLIEHLKTGGK